MDYAAERSLPREEPKGEEKPGGLWQIVREYATPRLTTAAIIWRLEAYTNPPLAIFCIETFGRWNGAFVFGCFMAVYSAIFLFLLEGERALGALKGWLRERRMVRLFVLPVKRSEGLAGAAGRYLAAPASFMILGPFQRAVAYRVLALKNWVAYPLSAGGAIPHSMFWTGLVFGGVWELLFRPALVWLWGQVSALAGMVF